MTHPETETQAPRDTPDPVVFGPLRIAWDHRVLEPRPWTAMQSRWAAELVAELPEGERATVPPLLEMCSGAGHIGLLAAALSGRRLVAVDLEPVACDYLRRNAAAAGLDDRVEVRQQSLQTALGDGELFAVVLADPPWVVSDGIAAFPDDPVLAIDGGDDGLDVARACLDAALGHLPPGGSLLLQLGDDAQAARLTTEAAAAGWTAGGLRRGEGGVVQQLLHP